MAGISDIQVLERLNHFGDIPIFEGVESDSNSLCENVKSALTKSRWAYVRNFPIDVDKYVAFVEALGRPLENYATIVASAEQVLHPKINVIAYKLTADSKTPVHYLSSELPTHSSRAWRSPRPRVLSMFMSESGWNNEGHHASGESVIVRWEYLFRRWKDLDPMSFKRSLNILGGTPVRFTPPTLIEPFSELPLIYPLVDSRNEFDLGVRLKVDMLSTLSKSPGAISDWPEYRQALEDFLKIVSMPTMQACFAMQTGDIILVDNDRFGHGRHPFLASKVINGLQQSNPRAIWSVTIE